MPYESGYADERPQVPLRMLKRNGLLDGKSDKLAIESNGARILIRMVEPTYALFLWKDHGPPRPQMVAVVWSEMTFGQRPAFVCPLTQRQCNTLYLSQGRWASAAGHSLVKAGKRGNRTARRWIKLDRAKARLFGLNGLAKARGDNRRRIVENALDVEFATVIAPEVQEVARQIQKRDLILARRPLRSNRVKDAGSTQRALLAGGLDPHELEDEDVPGLLGRMSSLHRTDPVGKARAQLPLAILEDHAALDMRALMKALPRAGCWSRTLAWPAFEDVGSGRYLLAADLRDRAKPRMAISGLDQEMQNHVQTIAISPVGGSKPDSWVLICPIRGTRHDVLFLREGLFASAKAQRLVHRSQRAA